MLDHADRFIQWKLLQEGTAMTIYVNLFILSIVQYSTAVGSFLENFLSLSTSLDS